LISFGVSWHNCKRNCRNYHKDGDEGYWRSLLPRRHREDDRRHRCYSQHFSKLWISRTPSRLEKSVLSLTVTLPCAISLSLCFLPFNYFINGEKELSLVFRQYHDLMVASAGSSQDCLINYPKGELDFLHGRSQLHEISNYLKASPQNSQNLPSLIFY
jgi:hypothetical protein